MRRYEASSIVFFKKIIENRPKYVDLQNMVIQGAKGHTIVPMRGGYGAVLYKKNIYFYVKASNQLYETDYGFIILYLNWLKTMKFT